MGCQIKLKHVYALAGNRANSAIESLTDIPLVSPKGLIVLLSAHTVTNPDYAYTELYFRGIP